MSQLLRWFSSNAAALGILGAAIAFVWSTFQQVAQRKAEAREREFQAFHKLVRDLVAPHRLDGAQGLDAQAAIIYELRQFRRYHEFTERLLLRLKTQFQSMAGSNDLVEEIDLTLQHIEHNK